MTDQPAPETTIRPRRRQGRGTLLIVATLLVGSGLIRLGEGAGKAFAKASDPGNAMTSADATAACAPAPDVMALLEALRAREDRVAEREANIADRAQSLRLAEEQVQTQLVALVAAEEELARTITIADGAADADVARLVTLYENMKPKDAAPLFEEMAPEFAAGFLARMRPDAAAAVLAGLQPKAAYYISVVMAGRNANAPKN